MVTATSVARSSSRPDSRYSASVAYPRRRRRRSREDRGADLVGEVRGSGEPPSESGDVPDQPERDRDVGGEDADRDERRDAREPRGHLSEQGDEFGGDRLHYRPYSVGDLMRIGRRELAGRLPAADAPRGAYGTPAERPIMAPAEDDISIEEKRVYAGTAGRTDAYVATESGVVRVALSADKIGAFDMVAREPARDAAVLPRRDAPDLLGVATPDGLQVAPVGDDLAFEPVDVDPVGSKSLVAVGVHDDAFLVAGEDGEINGIEFGDEESDPTATSIGTVSDPRAVDGPSSRPRTGSIESQATVPNSSRSASTTPATWPDPECPSRRPPRASTGWATAG